MVAPAAAIGLREFSRRRVALRLCPRRVRPLWLSCGGAASCSRRVALQLVDDVWAVR